MTAGVAVVFKTRFGKPQTRDCLTKHLACQRAPDGATVYSLVTKAHFDGKPTEQDYNAAFKDLEHAFKREGFKTLICSPMGCVRDLVKLHHFARNIEQFHRSTGATVVIVTSDHQARRVLRRGLPHPEFVKQLRSEIRKAGNRKQVQHPDTEHVEKLEGGESKTKTINSDWYTLPDEDIKLYMDQIAVPNNTLMLDPSVSHLMKNVNSMKELAEERDWREPNTYDYVLAPVNDREDDGVEGGGHWSLLLYSRHNNTYYHLDSLQPHNIRHAQKLAAQISGDPCVNVVQLPCCRQRSSVECGAYMVHFCDMVCSMIKNKLPIQDDHCYKQSFCVNNIYSTIKEIKFSNREGELPEKRRVTLLSDSHGRGLRHLLLKRLNGRSEVYSEVRPNAKFENVISGLDGELKKLSSNDHLVILGGTNDVCFSNDFDVKNCVREVAQKARHTNVTLCTVPLRYDRPDLNYRIRKINIDIVIEALKYDNIKVLSLSDVPSRNYTAYGLHLNKRGKEQLCTLMANKINEPILN